MDLESSVFNWSIASPIRTSYFATVFNPPSFDFIFLLLSLSSLELEIAPTARIGVSNPKSVLVGDVFSTHRAFAIAIIATRDIRHQEPLFDPPLSTVLRDSILSST
jgi:hypothetical protein